MVHPEFRASVSAKIGDAVLRRLRADSALRNYYTGGIIAAELEEIVDEQGYNAPALLVTLGAVEDEPLPSLIWNRLQFVDLVDVARISSREEATLDWFRARRLDHVKWVLLGTEKTGQLHDENGDPITEAAVSWQRWPKPIYAEAAAEIRTRVSFGVRAIVNNEMEFL